jgi:hypothetical protein
VMTVDQLNHHHYYKLVDGAPVACSPEEWSAWFVRSHRERTVARTAIGRRVVQTTFMSMRLGDDEQGRPLLWETIVLGLSRDDYERYPDARQWSSIADAHAGHLRMVAWLESMPPEPEVS